MPSAFEGSAFSFTSESPATSTRMFVGKNVNELPAMLPAIYKCLNYTLLTFCNLIGEKISNDGFLSILICSPIIEIILKSNAEPINPISNIWKNHGQNIPNLLKDKFIDLRKITPRKSKNKENHT